MARYLDSSLSRFEKIGMDESNEGEGINNDNFDLGMDVHICFILNWVYIIIIIKFRRYTIIFHDIVKVSLQFHTS